MVFLTPGEKVKKIRKELKMTQLELEDVNIKRNFISMIENGDRFASKKTAKTLSEKFNKRAKELGVDMHVDEKYLLSSPKEQADEYCNKKLQEIKDLTDFEEIIAIAEQYSLEEVKLNVYISKGKKYLKEHIYDEAFINFLRALDICKNLRNQEKQAMIFNSLGACKIEMAEYLEALEYYSKAYYYAVLNNDLRIKHFALYNISYVYNRLGKHDKAIEYADDLLSKCNTEIKLNMLVHTMIVKSNCLRDKCEFTEAVRILENLVPECKDDKLLLGYLYNNLASVYLKMKDYDKALKYYEDTQKLVDEYDHYHIHGNMLDKAQVYNDMGNCNEAIKLVEEGIKRAQEYNDIEYLFKGYYMLIDLYHSDVCSKKVKALCIEILDTLKNKGSNIDMRDLYGKLALIYLEENELDKSKEYLRLSLNLK